MGQEKQQRPEDHKRERARGPRPQTTGQDPESLEGPQGASMPESAEHCFQSSKVMLEWSFWKTTSAETELRLRAVDVLGERKTVNVSR